MVGITYGIEPYGGSSMGWTNPTVLAELGVGVAFLVLFCFIEVHTEEPMFRLQLFRIRPSQPGSSPAFSGRSGAWPHVHAHHLAAGHLAAPPRLHLRRDPPVGGHRAGPLTTGFLIGGPLSGILSDHYGSRPFATGGMLGSAVAFFLLEQVPVDFSYVPFAILLFFMGLVMSSFGASNRTGVMNSLPASDRGAGSGMNTTFQNSAQVLSIGIFFTLIIVGLSDHLPTALVSGLTAHGVPEATAQSISHLPPVSTLFAAFLGYNPAGHLLGPTSCPS